MSTYANGRRAPNVSQYLANLNTTPPVAANLATSNDFSALGADELDFLTNAEFFDFDNFEAPHVDEFPNPSGAQMPHHAPVYQVGEFQTYPANVTSNTTSPTARPVAGFFDASTPFPEDGEKRKASAAGFSSAPDYEEGARMAAEEDKRRRNTAASARFRVKKKQREQALEKQAKDMADKVLQLEGKVQQLEMENKWLKELITEKGEGKVVDISTKPAALRMATSTPSTRQSEVGSATGAIAKRNSGVGTESDD